MKLKYKIVLFNFLMFLVIFDVLYIIFWSFSIQMNPVKALLVATIAVLFTPWVKASKQQSVKKVTVKIFASELIRKLQKRNQKWQNNRRAA